MFKRTPDASTSGNSLRQYSNVHSDDLRRVFGKEDKDGYYEPENGYEGEEWTFTEEAHPGNTVSVYFRWGEARIGARDDDIAERFDLWLSDKLDNKR